MSRLFFILGFFLVFSACEDNPEDDGAPQTDNQIFFTGITPTDPNGLPLGNSDQTDWHFDDEWAEQELALFPSEPVRMLDCLLDVNIGISAFPNPSNGIFSLLLEMDDSMVAEFRLVDEDFNTLISLDSISDQIIQLNASNFGIQDTVRLYYRYIQNDCEFRGHGDILIE